MLKIRTIIGFFVLILIQNSISAQNTVTASVGTSVFSTQTGTPIVTDNNISVSANDQIENAMILIGNGYVEGEDILIYPAVLHGVTGTFDAQTGILSLSGSATAAQYQEIFRSILYDNAAARPAAGERQITFSLGDALPHYPCGATEPHFYKLIQEHGDDWNAARDHAETQTYYGFRGYMATIICEEENAFITEKLDASAFIGASDATTERVWKWETGPEAGTTFWNNGTTQTYANWNTAGDDEPNNTGGSEHYACIYGLMHPTWGQAGFWNDVKLVPGANDMIVGYVIEFGGMPDDPIQSIADIKTVIIEIYPLANLLVSGNTVCEGAEGAIVIDNSENGVNYQIFKGTTPIDTVLGDGTTLTIPIAKEFLNVGVNNFRFIADNGYYTSDLQNSATVTVIANPLTNRSVLGDSVCPETDAEISILGAENEVVYEVFLQNTLVGTGTGSGSALIINISHTVLLNGENTFEIHATRESCQSILQNTGIVTVNGFNITQIETAGSTVPTETDGTIYFAETENSIQYQALSTENQQLAGSVSGTGNSENITIIPNFLPNFENSFELYAVNGTCKLYLGSEIIFVKSEIKVPGGFSPNENNVNDKLIIRGIENFPDNTVKIFNRWGILVYETDGYDNETAVWQGIPQNNLTAGMGELPEGTYFYVITLGDGSAAVRGSLYLKL